MTMRGTGTAPAQHPGDTAPPTMAASHAHGAERGAMERGMTRPPQDDNKGECNKSMAKCTAHGVDCAWNDNNDND